MRPRVFPAEDIIARASTLQNNTGFNEAAGIPRGRRPERHHRHADRLASMRPRVFPAEDLDLYRVALCERSASMRPRVFPAEDTGRHRPADYEIVASMRPRVFPAEDVGWRF